MAAVQVDREITPDFVEYLKKNCEVKFYKDFAKPMYVAKKKGKYIIKGLTGNDRMNVVFIQKNFKDNVEDFAKLVEKYSNI